MIAFISDIHSNLAALDAVLADIDALGTVERIYCLGDVIGYGPQPIECLDVVASRCKLILMGNHEHVRARGNVDLGVMPVEAFVQKITSDIATKV